MPDINLSYDEIISYVTSQILTHISNNGSVPSGFAQNSQHVVATLMPTGNTTQIRAVATVTANGATSVSSSTISTDIRNYLNSLGINTSSQPTPRGILAFFAALAEFIGKSTVYYISKATGSSILAYVPASVSPITNPSGSLATASDVTTALNSLLNSASGAARYRVVSYAYSIVSCCCSSSCSSSSSSSSTSLFIAYFKL